MRKPLQLTLTKLTGILLVGFLASFGAAAEESHGDGGHGEEHNLPHHHVAALVGYALERKKTGDEDTLVVAFDYGYRYHEHWAVGAFFESLGDDTVRDVSIGLTLKYHPVNEWALFAGPGYEFGEKEDKFLVRFGTAYLFELRNRWTLGPEFNYDVLSSGDRVYILGLSLGREF